MSTKSQFDAKAIFWDIGGVILDLASVREAHRRFITRLCEQHAIDVEPTVALQRWRTVVGAHFRSREGTAYRSAKQAYTKGVNDLCDDSLPTQQWYPLFQETIRETIEPMPQGISVINRIHETPIHQGIISDIDTAEAEHILDAFDIADSFDSITTSEAVGRTKPDPAMFESALERAGVAPDASLMIGDRYEHDMEGAKRVGMSTISYGAGDGPEVDVVVEDLNEILEVLSLL